MAPTSCAKTSYDAICRSRKFRRRLSRANRSDRSVSCRSRMGSLDPTQRRNDVLRFFWCPERVSEGQTPRTRTGGEKSAGRKETAFPPMTAPEIGRDSALSTPHQRLWLPGGVRGGGRSRRRTGLSIHFPANRE